MNSRFMRLLEQCLAIINHNDADSWRPAVEEFLYEMKVTGPELRALAPYLSGYAVGLDVAGLRAAHNLIAHPGEYIELRRN